jgi:hypothetical protein
MSRGGPPTGLTGRLVAFASEGETLMRIAIFLSALIASGGVVRADEEKIGVKDLPKAVRAAVKAKFPEAKLTEAAREEEGGKTVYEVTLEDDDDIIDVAVSAKGKILEVEKTIEAKKLPKAVAAKIKAKYPKAKIKKAEQIVKYEEDEEEKYFEVVLTSKGQDDFEVKLSRKGKIIDDEGDDDDDDDDKSGKKKDKDHGDKSDKKDRDKD